MSPLIVDVREGSNPLEDHLVIVSERNASELVPPIGPV